LLKIPETVSGTLFEGKSQREEAQNSSSLAVDKIKTGG
jgi:hypothetical protein